MKKLYIVCWGHASTDDDGNSVANCGVVGAYASCKRAEEALEADLEDFIESVLEDYEGDDVQIIRDGMQIYGSVKEGYFEVDYEGAFNNSEYRVEIVEQEAQED